MSDQYSHETHEILSDFLEGLRQEPDLDPVFYAQVEALVASGKLANEPSVRRIIQDLERRSDESDN